MGDHHTLSFTVWARDCAEADARAYAIATTYFCGRPFQTIDCAAKANPFFGSQSIANFEVSYVVMEARRG